MPAFDGQTGAMPAYPVSGDTNAHASASFIYSAGRVVVPESPSALLLLLTLP